MASPVSDTSPAARASARSTESSRPPEYDFDADGLPRLQLSLYPGVNPTAWRHTVSDAHPSTVNIGDAMDAGLTEKDGNSERAVLDDEMAAAGGRAEFDAAAEEAYETRVEAEAAEARRVSSEISGLEYELRTLRENQERHVESYGYENGLIKRLIAAAEAKLTKLRPQESWVTLALHDLHADLSLGKVQGAKVGEGMGVGWDDLRFTFADKGNGVYVARLHADNLAFGMGQSEDGQSSSLTVGAGEFDVRARLTQLFEGGEIVLDGTSPMANPIKGDVLAGSSVKDFRLTYASLMTRR